ncbi:MAG: alkaline phosphatase [Bacteroidales bacterium]
MKNTKSTGIVLFALLTLFFTTSCSTTARDNANNQNSPKNIILLIGDGMSFAHLQAGILASENSLTLEQFNNIGFIKTSSASDFITDSGAAGTAIATGVKTNNGSIGMDPDGNPVKSILHIADQNGLSTGIVATCDITHATPASFIAHQPSRNMAEAIALDFLDTDVDVFIGGGRSRFEDREDGRDLLEELETKGYQLAYHMDEVKQVSSGKLAGFIAEGHPPKYSEQRGDMLPEAVEKAISIISQNPEGFFIIIEGSQIDWGGHDNDIDYIVNEVLDFDRAVGKAMDFARQDGETLVVVTSDHDTGVLALHGFDPETREVAAGFTTGGHTGLMQPVFAWGPGAEKFTGIYENADIFDKMLESYGFSKN